MATTLRLCVHLISLGQRLGLYQVHLGLASLLQMVQPELLQMVQPELTALLSALRTSSCG